MAKKPQRATTALRATAIKNAREMALLP